MAAVNAGGQAVLDSAAGPGLNRIFGVAFQELEPSVRDSLQGIRFCSDPAQFGLSWTVGLIESETWYGKPSQAPSAGDPPGRLRNISRWIDQGQKFAANMAKAPSNVIVDTSFAGNWTTFGPRITRALLATAAGSAEPRVATSAIGVVVHEFEHLRSPSSSQQWRDGYLDQSFEKRMDLPLMEQVAQIAPRNWLEEATATVLSQWPGRLRGHMADMGIAASYVNVPDIDYEHATAGVRKLLVLAGTDVTKPSQRGLADEILQRRDLKDVPRALAESIVRTNRLDPALTSQLSEKIEHASTKLEILTQPELIEKRIAAIEEIVRAGAGKHGG